MEVKVELGAGSGAGAVSMNYELDSFARVTMSKQEPTNQGLRLP